MEVVRVANETDMFDSNDVLTCMSLLCYLMTNTLRLAATALPAHVCDSTCMPAAAAASDRGL